MANQKLEIIFARRPPINYVSPNFCVNEFSSTSEPSITLTPFAVRRGPTGLILGGSGNVRLSWDSYPGALCYSVYKSVDEDDPFSEYVLVAECIENNFIDLDSFGPGFYRVSAITPEGETELSEPIFFSGSSGPMPYSIVDTGLGATVHKLGENGHVVGVDASLSIPAVYREGSLIRLPTLGGTFGSAADVNSSGVIVGQSTIPGDISLRVTRWTIQASGSTGGFVQPPVGFTVDVSATDTMVSVGDGIFIPGGGTYSVVATASGMLTLRNLYASNTAAGENIPASVAKKIGVADITGSSSNNPFINSAGKIAYQSTLGTDVSIFTPPSTITHIGKAEPGSQEQIVGLNNNDELALTVSLPSFALATHAMRWSGGSFTDVDPGGTFQSFSFAIAPNQSYVVGAATFIPFDHGFLSLGGPGTDIGTLGGNFSALVNVNDAGIGVGNAQDGGLSVRAIKYQGGIINLGAFFSGQSEAFDINAAGYVIGNADDPSTNAVVWAPDNVPTNLNDLPLTGTEYHTLYSGQQVNNNKQATAFGAHDSGPNTIALIQLPPTI